MEFVAPFGTGTGFRLSNNKTYRIHIMNRRDQERKWETGRERVEGASMNIVNTKHFREGKKNFFFLFSKLMSIYSIVFMSNKQRSIKLHSQNAGRVSNTYIDEQKAPNLYCFLFSSTKFQMIMPMIVWFCSVEQRKVKNFVFC